MITVAEIYPNTVSYKPANTLLPVNENLAFPKLKPSARTIGGRSAKYINRGVIVLYNTNIFQYTEYIEKNNIILVIGSPCSLCKYFH